MKRWLTATASVYQPAGSVLLLDVGGGVGLGEWAGGVAGRSASSVRETPTGCIAPPKNWRRTLILPSGGIVTHSVKAGALDLATPSGRAVARTLCAWARFESEHKGERIRAARRQAAEQGRW